MRIRTTKAERHRARRRFAIGCRAWGTARCARLMRADPGLLRLPMALHLAIPPEIIAPADAGLHWSHTAPFGPPGTLPDPLADGLARLVEEMGRQWLAPALERLGLDPADYTVAYATGDWTWEAPTPLEDA